MCPVDGISVHTRRHQTRRRSSSKKKTEQLSKQTSIESLPQDFSLVGQSALSTAPSLSGSTRTTTMGRIQRGAAAQHGRHPKLPLILPQLVIGSAAADHAQVTHHHKLARRSLAHKALLPSVGSPDSSINITGIPISSDLRYNVVENSHLK